VVRFSAESALNFWQRADMFAQPAWKYLKNAVLAR
jgi:hypothetical protein